jgi:hypothetical protein
MPCILIKLVDCYSQADSVTVVATICSAPLAINRLHKQQRPTKQIWAGNQFSPNRWHFSIRLCRWKLFDPLCVAQLEQRPCPFRAVINTNGSYTCKSSSHCRNGVLFLCKKVYVIQQPTAVCTVLLISANRHSNVHGRFSHTLVVEELKQSQLIILFSKSI